MQRILIRPQDLYALYKPSRCERRVYLEKNEMEEAVFNSESQSWEQAKEADFHLERYRINRLDKYLDLSKGTLDKREEKTLQAVEKKSTVLYKPRFRFEYHDTEREHLWELEAEPDFLEWHPEGVEVQLVRNARRVQRENHGDIFIQAQVFAWIISRYTPVYRISILNAQGKATFLQPWAEEKVLERLTRIVSLINAEETPYHPVSWTRCQKCAFRDYCWAKAEHDDDLALIPNVEAALILALRETGVTTVKGLTERFEQEELSQFEWLQGQKMQKLGHKRAHTILQTAQVMQTGIPHILHRPKLPDSTVWAMFDVEAIPSQPNRPERVYLWGVCLRGEASENRQQIAPENTKSCDKKNWKAFLESCEELFQTHGDVPFIHWGSFEKQSLNMYIKRFGDSPEETAERVKRNLIDFYEVLKKNVLIPLPSYSLKVIEKYVGFDRPDQDTGGYWSVVNYLKAAGLKNSKRRQEVLDQILEYNASDLEGMWQVLLWLQDQLENGPSKKQS